MMGRIPRSPGEGWVSLGLVLLLAMTIAWSLDDAAWVHGREAYTDFLSLAVIGGVLAGFAGAKLAWGRWATYLFGSLIAALLIPVYAGGVLEPGGDWADQYRATATAVVGAWQDLAILNRSVTQQYGHFLLVLGLFTWASAMYASFTVFGHRRPLNAIILVGLILVANMAFTVRDQLTYLVIFSLAALFLLIRFRVLDEQAEWIRRRIGDPSSISSVYLRGGTVFIAFAVVGSLVLTQTASSAPLASAWRGIGDRVIEWGRDLQRYLPTGGSNRAFGVSFGSSTQITGVWTTDSALAATIQFPSPETREFYWRAVTFDRFELTGWSRSPVTEETRPGGEQLLTEAHADWVGEEGRREVRFTVIPENFRGSTVLSPQMPQVVSDDVRLLTIGEGGYFSAVERGSGDGAYSVIALVPVVGDDDPRGLTENRLRVAGTDYPDEVLQLYLDVPDGAIPPGGDAEQLLADILANVPADNPYDIAATMEAYLKSNRFRYDTDVRDLACERLSTVECFARFRQGYCEYYATTMTILLRQHGIPARLAEGFLPGTRDVTGIEPLYNSSAHAWVEVYFPGFGWVDFDPTGGGIAQIAPLPAGEEQDGPIASLEPRSIPPRILEDPDIPGAGANPGAGPTPGATGSATGPLIAATVLLLVIVGALVFVAWQRGPRGPVTPDGAYGMLTRLAGRLGFGPGPTQTVYEYAGALGDILPQSRPEIHTVAQAKVEVAYGKRLLGEDRLQSLRDAQRRLRVGLLRLVLKRGRRGRR